MMLRRDGNSRYRPQAEILGWNYAPIYPLKVRVFNNDGDDRRLFAFLRNNIICVCASRSSKLVVGGTMPFPTICCHPIHQAIV